MLALDTLTDNEAGTSCVVVVLFSIAQHEPETTITCMSYSTKAQPNQFHQYYNRSKCPRTLMQKSTSFALHLRPLLQR